VEDDNAFVEAGGFSRQLAFAEAWLRPEFPLRGNDLAAIGGQQGRKLGDLLRELEGLWVETGFTLDRDALLERAAERLGN
jgi:tRNA nucleotidyltransferase/poly(A) polymerase